MKLPIPELKEGEERVSMDAGTISAPTLEGALKETFDYVLGKLLAEMDSQNAENRIASIRGYAAIETPGRHVFMITIECQPPAPPPSPEEIEKAMEDSGLIM